MTKQDLNLNIKAYNEFMKILEENYKTKLSQEQYHKFTLNDFKHFLNEITEDEEQEFGITREDPISTLSMFNHGKFKLSIFIMFLEHYNTTGRPLWEDYNSICDISGESVRWNETNKDKIKKFEKIIYDKQQRNSPQVAIVLPELTELDAELPQTKCIIKAINGFIPYYEKTFDKETLEIVYNDDYDNETIYKYATAMDTLNISVYREFMVIKTQNYYKIFYLNHVKSVGCLKVIREDIDLSPLNYK